MVAYQESVPARRLMLLLLVLFPVLYVTHLGVQELRSQEALLASIATDVGAGGNPLTTTVHGEQVRVVVRRSLVHIDVIVVHPDAVSGVARQALKSAQSGEAADARVDGEPARGMREL